MTARVRVHLEGTVPVALPQSEAFELFTPTGERRWARGWDPSFPAPVPDETTPGAVFETRGHRPTTWVVAACERPRCITYANVSERSRAGLVRVCCEEDRDGTTTARVTYDMTALSEDGDASLSEFAAGYQQFMEHWRDAIAETTGRR